MTSFCRPSSLLSSLIQQRHTVLLRKHLGDAKRTSLSMLDMESSSSPRI